MHRVNDHDGLIAKHIAHVVSLALPGQLFRVPCSLSHMHGPRGCSAPLRCRAALALDRVGSQEPPKKRIARRAMPAYRVSRIPTSHVGHTAHARVLTGGGRGPGSRVSSPAPRLALGRG